MNSQAFGWAPEPQEVPLVVWGLGCSLVALVPHLLLLLLLKDACLRSRLSAHVRVCVSAAYARGLCLYVCAVQDPDCVRLGVHMSI